MEGQVVCNKSVKGGAPTCPNLQVFVSAHCALHSCAYQTNHIRIIQQRAFRRLAIIFVPFHTSLVLYWGGTIHGEIWSASHEVKPEKYFKKTMQIQDKRSKRANEVNCKNRDKVALFNHSKSAASLSALFKRLVFKYIHTYITCIFNNPRSRETILVAIKRILLITTVIQQENWTNYCNCRRYVADRNQVSQEDM